MKYRKNIQRPTQKNWFGDRCPQSNGPEKECWWLLTNNGWRVTKRGWPDFVAYKNGSVVLVEVKPHRSRRLKKHQRMFMDAMAKRGILCYRWTADGSFDRIGITLPGDERKRQKPKK